MNILRRAYLAFTDFDGKTILAMAKTSEARLQRSRAMLTREIRHRKAAEERAEKAESELDFLRSRVEHYEGVLSFAKREQKLLIRSHDALSALVESNIAVHSARKQRADQVAEQEQEYQ